MLSYRHAYHAGNFADVLKHSTLCWIVQALKQKEKPFVYFDTHSGAGLYDLQAIQAVRNSEYQQGIGRLWQEEALPEFFKPYREIIRSSNPDGVLKYYPGSPYFVRRLLRDQDRMVLMELHSREVPQLEAVFAGDRQVKIFYTDGFQGLIARLPPKERRGLVLLDPSYEVKEDYKTLVNTVKAAGRIFATGVYCIWYPVVDRAQTESLARAFVRSNIRCILRVELCIAADQPGLGMTGSGLIIINPPWQLDQVLRQNLGWLAAQLSAAGAYSVDWLVPE